MPNLIMFGGLVYDDGKKFFYKDGDECVALTGGWIVGYSGLDGSQLKGATYLSLTANATTSSTARRTYVTNNLIDLTNITTLYFEIEQTAAEANRYGVYSLKSDKTSSSNIAQVGVNSGTVNTKRVESLDVSALNGSYYIAVNVAATSSVGAITAKVTKVWGE